MKYIGAIFCFFGAHKWEKEPIQKDIVRGTGRHFIFMSEGIQKATQLCSRKKCKKERGVYREGWVGFGSSASNTRWKKMTKSIEEYIDSLPNVFQA
ncbi:MAG: hypothetical protein WCV80_02695 [Candidatus Paceibacterota bacterium]|jgi:hypothetical protein